MMVRRSCGLTLFAIATVPPVMAAQEPARVEGVTLPRAYFQRLRQDPTAFQLPGGGWIARAADARARSTAVGDTLRLAVVLGLFADSPEPQITSEDVQRVLFDGPSDYGTASEFYTEASGGRFALTGQTFPWVRTSLTMSEVVGSSYGLGGDARVGEYLEEVLTAVDSMVDFGLFDNDGPDGLPNSGDDDGVVDAVAFEYLEVAASCGGPAIWPHRWGISGWLGSPYVTDDPAVESGGRMIVIDGYTTQSVTDCGGVNVQTAGTITHELGHVLGLPDLYDASQGVEADHRRWVVGCWSLMAAGSWGCGADDRVAWVRPTHMGAWERIRLGWVSDVEEVGAAFGREYTLDPVRTGGTVLHIPLGTEADPTEYLLVEYRDQGGFDQDLPAAGVLVYHIDMSIPGNRPCDTCAQIYMVGMLEADGNESLRHTFAEGGNRGEAGDAWGVTGPGTIAYNTNPSTRLNSGSASPITIDDISIVNGVAHVTVTAVVITAERLSQPFLLSGPSVLTADELAYLDRFGNANGEYDVGDLRAYLRR